MAICITLTKTVTYVGQRWQEKARNKMAEQKKEQKEYFVGEIEQQAAEGRLLIPVIARPDGTALNQLQVQVEILNKLDQITKLLREL